eukprot:UN0695
MSILYIALSMGIHMPEVLPIAALAFFLMHLVHKEMFERNVFSVDFEMDRQFEVNIVSNIFRAVALLWILTALFFYMRAPKSVEEVTNLWIPIVPLLHALTAGVLFAFALVAFVAGWLLFAEGGWLEMRIWRRRGERAAGCFVMFCNIVGVIFLIAAVAWFCRPPAYLKNIRIPCRTVYAVALLFVAFLSGLTSLVIQSLGRRLIRGTSEHRPTREMFNDNDRYMDENGILEWLRHKHRPSITSNNNSTAPRRMTSFMISGSWYSQTMR